MATRPRSDKVTREVVHAEPYTSKTCEKPGEPVHFPFFALPLELCVRILKYAREDGEKFRETRLVCRAMNDIIESNRANIGPMLLQRLFVGQHSAFDQGPKRFVVSDLKKLPDRSSSCAHTSIQQAFFYKVSLDASTVKHLIKELQRNHVHIRGMVFYRVVFGCDGDLLVEFFEALRIVCLIVLECQLPGNLAEFLARHEFIAKLKSHFIGSTDSFFYYNCIMDSKDDEWLKWFIKFTFPSVMAPPLPLDDLFNTRVLCSVGERLRSVALNREYYIFVFKFPPGTASYFESFSAESFDG